MLYGSSGDLVVNIPANQKKYCWNNYHSLKLAKSAKNATSFITKWVWYPYWQAHRVFIPARMST